MIWIDYIILSMIAFSVFISLFRGFIYEALSLFTWVCAFFLSNVSHEYIMTWLPLFFGNYLIRKIIAITLPFFITMIIGALLNNLIRILVVKNGLSGTDRILGICFGAIRGVLIVSLIIFSLNIFTDIAKSTDWKKSQLIPHVNHLIKNFFDYCKTYRILNFDEHKTC
ncbi:colicin V production protein [Candidatus Pantoea edessiphila]|uniref:Colicin V production protein n=1 Tax=Candidatus Pantoea edessiphila TaxID=2044610 RepID=A0A2P5SYH2_9GAMM|nr:CvpA family protein [Candidatus Pantoea edessiphila]MBK4775482.1 colicin V production protein [Pantoea sp. Edef]PPI87389.1 colicin V production protein [Candidatus Pantoea edessiphila]